MGSVAVDDKVPSAPAAGATTNGVHHEQFAGPLEPIAIIGLSCRYPGASNSQKLWESLAAGSSGWSKGPGKRFNMEAIFDPNNSHVATTNTDGGHFLSGDIAAFDAPFFGIHAAEASAMDPQQRVMLEVAYESFENAGLSPEKIWGKNIGVYVGQWTNDYGEVLSRDTEFPATYQTTGTGPAITSNRISYHFNLLGPSFTTDTGCSSSLVALHSAVQSIRTGETEMGFVGGVNLLVDPQRFVYQSKLKMFSKEGRSFPFDHRANGYGRGEGCGGVVLKPLSAALRDGDHIRAVIRNSVLNQDGRTPGISVPSGEAQERAIRKAYADAGLELGADYVEAHGTGTLVGDPIELEAIAAAFSSSRTPENRIPVGSIKGNVGHTESAAGIAGLIKAVLMLENGAIPPQVNFEKPNPKIRLDEWNMRVPQSLEPFDLNRISVNSFGYGGTNAHVIVDSAKNLNNAKKQAPKDTGSRPRVFIISGASENSCQKFAADLAEFVEKTEASVRTQGWLDRLVYTLNLRTIYPHRAFVVAEDAETLVSKLQAVSKQPIAQSSDQSKTRLAYIFSGQGAQYYNMGRELIQTCAPFRNSLERANKHMASLGCTWDVFEELNRSAEESRLDEPTYGQPLSTAVQLSLTDALSAAGLKPVAVAGHSSGEIAAAYSAGYLTFEDAMTASYHRGRLASELIKRESDLHGAMMAVGASSRVVEDYIAALDPEAGKIGIACFNSPASVTVSGDLSGIQALSKVLEDDSVFNRVLRTNGAAYHSDQMRRIEEEYLETLKDIKVQEGHDGVSMFSSLTGCEIESGETDGSYWGQNLVSPVLFEDALWGLCQDSEGGARVDIILEIGPHAQLEGPVKQTIQSFVGDSTGIKYASTLKRKTNAVDKFFGCLAYLYGEGITFDLHLANNGFQKVETGVLAELPPYSFDHEQTYWHESRLSKAFTQRSLLPHELLGNLSADVNKLEPRWRRYISLKDIPWVQGHIVQGQVVFPAAGYLSMAVEAIRRHKKMTDPEAKITSYEFHNISIGKAFILTEDMKEQEICLSLRPEPRTARNSSNAWMEFRIFTVVGDQSWTEHCRGIISATTAAPPSAGDVLKPAGSDFTVRAAEVQQAIGESNVSVGSRKFYFLSKDIGLDWKSPFNNVVDMKLGSDTSVSTVTVPDLKQDKLVNEAPKYIVHPATLDAALFHGLCSILLLRKGLDAPPVPTFIRDLSISAEHHDLPGNDLTCYATRTDGPFTFDVVVSANKDQLVLRAEGVSATKLPADFFNASARELTHSVQWITYCQAMTAKRLDAIVSPTVANEIGIGSNELMNALVLSYTQKAIKEVGLEKVVEGYRRQWYEWMKEHAADAFNASLVPESGVIPSLGPPGEAISRIGKNLNGILTGDIEPLDVLNKEGLLSKLYSDERCQQCYRQMSAYIQELGKQNPGMKVLEVGAGTGGASEPILEALCSGSNKLVSKYEFTDISSGFFEAAKERLAKFTDVTNYRIFDAEKDVAAQGYETGSYDLVLACNVVHATKSIGKTLDGVRALLRPGGVFVLMEITTDQLYYNLVFGSLPGWWLGDSEGRSASPLLPESRWISELTSHGFNSPTACLHDYPGEEGTQTVFIASADSVSHDPTVLPVEIVTDKDITPELPNLVADLQKELGTEDISTVDIIGSLRPGVVSVFPPEICEKLAGDFSPESWDKFKERWLGSKAILFVTRGATGDVKRPLGGIMTGFSRCFRVEHTDARVITLDLDPDSDTKDCSGVVATVLKSPTFDVNKGVNDVENEFAERAGQLYVSRLFNEPNIDRYIRDANGASEPQVSSFLGNDRILTAELKVPGLLDTLRWKDVEPAPLDPNEIQLDLRAASINFKDVLIAAGQLEGITEMKNDCAGVVTHVGANMTGRFKKGDRVCCYYSRSYTNRPRVHGDCCAIVPEKLSFEEAASLPIVWGTVYYSLVDMGRLSKGDSVLIHSAAGAVGQAAILLSQYLGAEVFVTVSTPEKRDFLTKTYGIPEDHVFSSRSTTFGRGVREMTGGRGVTVVLNSLSGDMFRETCNTVAPYGRFVEIGRKDFMEDMMMPSRFLLKNITFSYVDLALMIDDNKPLVRRVLQDVMDHMAAGSIRPTSIMTMPISEIETAFRQIQAGKHIGKVILTVEDGQEAKIVPPPPEKIGQFKSTGSYLIVGGLGGLGKSIVPWMAARGARNIISISRSGAGEDALPLIEEMRSQGIYLMVRKCDVSSLASVKALVNEIEGDKAFGPIRGVFNSAMVVRDTMLANMSHEQWTAALSPKIAGSWNLHEALPNTIDFLIFMSSGVAISGNPGQCNYAAGCSYQDALAHYRCSNGLPAYSLNVGAVIDSGFVSENPDVAMALRRQGLGTITTAELLSNLDYVLSKENKADPEHCQSVLGLIPTGNEPGLRPSTWMAQSRFRHLSVRGNNSSEAAGGSGMDFLESLTSAGTPEEALQHITEGILQQLSKLIATPVKQLSPERSLDDYGVDSLVAVELRNWLSAFMQASIPLLGIRSTKSINELARLVAQESRLTFAK